MDVYNLVLGQAMNRSLEEGAPVNAHDEMMSKLRRSNFFASMNRKKKMMMIASRNKTMKKHWSFGSIHQAPPRS